MSLIRVAQEPDNFNEYWIDTAWGCGSLTTKNGIVVESAPIFRKFLGKQISYLMIWYRIVPLNNLSKGVVNENSRRNKNKI